MTRRADPRAIPSPNVWRWPDVYEVENRAQDVHGAIWAALRERAPWAGRAVVDIGCGDGFHLPLFARDAAHVTGVEPHAGLVARAIGRTAALGNVDVRRGHADETGLAAGCVDVAHARTAYFFGPGCEPGLREADRVLRPGGTLAIVDIDATAEPYGRWLRADVPRYDAAGVQAFFDRHGFDTARVDTTWRFTDRAALESVLRIEFAPAVAAAAIAETRGLEIDVRYRLHTRVRPSGLLRA